MRGKDLSTDDTEVFVVFRSIDGRLLKHVTDQHVTIKSCLRVKLLVACFTQEIISRPVLLQSHLQLGVMNHHVATHLELAHKGFSANVAVVILPDLFLWLLSVLMDGHDVTIH